MASLPNSKRRDYPPDDRSSPSPPSRNLRDDGRTYKDSVSRTIERESSFFNHRIAVLALSLVLVFNNIIFASKPKLSFSSFSESSSKSKVKQMTAILESSSIRYYVYDDDKLVLSDYREKAIQDAPKTWRAKWGHRYFDYSRGEIRWIEALERHPQRTRDPCEADFFVVPILLSLVPRKIPKSD